MNNADYVRLVGVAGPVVTLLALGFTLTLRSGVAELGTGQGLRRAIGNLSFAVLIVLACLVGLFLLQGVIRAPTQIR